MATIYIIVRYWPGGKRVSDSAYLSEESARIAASKLVGTDGALVALETVELKDLQSMAALGNT